jgi:ribosomal protein RSM22 (predicted rRNA methylase)
VQLPSEIRSAIEERAEAIGFAVLERAAAEISAAYRAGSHRVRIPDAERTAAYLATRMPATYAAAFAVMRELRTRLGEAKIESLLDVGSGTGAASLAARAWFPDARITMMERDSAFASAARQWLPDAALLQQDIERAESFPKHDLVVAAYSLGELDRIPIQALWQAAGVALVVIEPGSPAGFAVVRRIRDELRAAEAHIAAPCPAQADCPIPEGDWCHFAARVERSRIHRRLKHGDMSYEDEKFSYVALVRDAVKTAPARIIRRPQQKPGLITLETCAPDGLRQVRATRRDRDAFRAARHAGWGDAWNGPRSV